MATRRTYAFDVVNGALVQYAGSATAISTGTFFQRSLVNLLIQFVKPRTTSFALPNPFGNAASGYDLISDAERGNMIPRITIASQATGTDDDEDLYALAKLREPDFTWDATLSGFTAALNLNTDKMTAWIDTAASRAAIFELRVSTDGVMGDTFVQEAITVYANTDEGGDPPFVLLGGVPMLNLPFTFRKVRGDGSVGIYILDENATQNGIEWTPG